MFSFTVNVGRNSAEISSSLWWKKQMLEWLWFEGQYTKQILHGFEIVLEIITCEILNFINRGLRPLVITITTCEIFQYILRVWRIPSVFMIFGHTLIYCSIAFSPYNLVCHIKSNRYTYIFTNILVIFYVDWLLLKLMWPHMQKPFYMGDFILNWLKIKWSWKFNNKDQPQPTIS